MQYKVILSDVHLNHQEAQHPAYLAVKKMIKEIKPEEIIINGDFLDFSYLSSYTENAPRLRENYRLKKDADLAVSELELLKKYSKTITYLEGNHEYRIARALDTLPMFEGLIELNYLLDLDRLAIKWVPEMKQPMRIFDDLYILHGKRIGKYFASQITDDYPGVTMIQGHTHRGQVFTKSHNLTQSSYEGIGSGCLTGLKQSYENGKALSHSQGFVVVSWENEKRYSVQNVTIKDSHWFIFNGKMYSGL